MTWRWWRHAEDTSGEARRHLAELAARDDEVAALGAELRERQRVNHFSELVWAAVSRASGGDR